MCILTHIDKTTGWPFTKLFTFIRKRHLDDTRNVTWRRLYTYCMWCDEFTPHEHCAENNLKTIEKIITNNYDLCTTRCPAFTRWYRFDAWLGYGKWRIKTWKIVAFLELIWFSDWKCWLSGRLIYILVG